MTNNVPAIISGNTERFPDGAVMAYFYCAGHYSARVSVHQPKPGEEPHIYWYTESDTSIYAAERVTALLQHATKFAKSLEGAK